MFNRIKPHIFALISAVFLAASTLDLYWQNSFAARQTPQKTESIVLGMGCFWGAEKRMSALPGVIDVVSGYAGGNYSDPSYRKIIASEDRNDAGVPIATSVSPLPPKGWKLKNALWATPTIVLFRDGKEAARYTGYNGEKKLFWDWLGSNTLPEG